MNCYVNKLNIDKWKIRLYIQTIPGGYSLRVFADQQYVYVIIAFINREKIYIIN
ncbi:hypothetical protein CLOBL_28580 [Clostridium sp. BL-8]|nr:hypothetical protein CLOBL_28580 [Clostridium sp. BL-8]